MQELDKTDKRILALLQEDAKLTTKEIAEDLGLTNTPVYERIKRLEKTGMIKGYHAQVDRNKVGLTMVVFCLVTLESHNQQNISQFVKDVRELDEVMECYHIAGMFDYVLKICVKDMPAYQQFVNDKLIAIAKIGKLQSSFVMNEIKNELVYKV